MNEVQTATLEQTLQALRTTDGTAFEKLCAAAVAFLDGEISRELTARYALRDEA